MKWIRDHLVSILSLAGGIIVAAVMVGMAFADSTRTEKLATDNEIRIRSLEQLRPAIDDMRDDLREIRTDVKQLIRQGAARANMTPADEP